MRHSIETCEALLLLLLRGASSLFVIHGERGEGGGGNLHAGLLGNLHDAGLPWLPLNARVTLGAYET